jgi:enoyl-CoA hydratase/carnithine racemase
MLLAGGTITGQQGFEAGLVTHLCELDELMQATEKFATNLTLGGKEAMAVTKRWLNELDGSLDNEVMKKAADLSAKVIGGREAQTRLRSLFKK